MSLPPYLMLESILSISRKFASENQEFQNFSRIRGSQPAKPLSLGTRWWTLGTQVQNYDNFPPHVIPSFAFGCTCTNIHPRGSILSDNHWEPSEASINIHVTSNFLFCCRRGFFNACVRNIKYGRSEKDLAPIDDISADRLYVYEKCNLTYCNKPEPLCKNEGVCKPTGETTFMCDCRWTGYKGENCTKRKYSINCSKANNVLRALNVWCWGKLFCLPERLDISRGKAEGNIETRGKRKLTVSGGTRY